MTSRSRRVGKWVRVDKALKPSNARAWYKLGKTWFTAASNLTSPLKWDATSGRCFNRCGSRISNGRGRLVRSLPKESVFLTGVDYEKAV